MRGNGANSDYSLSMTQEADQSPAKAGAAAARGAARQPAAPAAGQQHAPGQARGAGQTYGAGPAHAAGPGHAPARGRAGGRAARKPQRPSLGGGTPAQDRELRAQGRETVRKLLEAGIIEFEERGFNGVRVDDVVQRAGISHGTFYLYFSNKEDLFKALVRDALHDMETIAGDFPVVTGDETGLKVLRQWIRKFFDVYAIHSTALRTLSSASAPGEMFSDALKLFYSITEAMTTGMTAAGAAAGRRTENAELTAFACMMMLEKVNFVATTEIQLPTGEEVVLPVDEMADAIANILFAAFGLTSG
jgi:AcrR family transcriptional regulator